MHERRGLAPDDHVPMPMRLFKTSRTSAPSGLPLHAGEGRAPSKQTKFELPPQEDSWARRLRSALLKITHASTGTPSDGLGGEGSASTASIIADYRSAVAQQLDEKNGTDWMLDEIIVDSDLNDADSRPHTHTASEKGTTEGSLRRNFDRRHSGASDHSIYSSWLRGLKSRVWPHLAAFFDPHFEDPDRELDYQKQDWYTTKAFTTFFALFLYLNWILFLALNRSETLFEKIAYDGGLSLVTLPIPVMVAFDMPLKRPVLFQIALLCAVWYCCFLQAIQTRVCGFFTADNRCNGKDFLAMSYYSTGLPALAMFVAMRRLYAAAAQLAFFCVLVSLIATERGIYARNIVNFAVFSVFLQALHYSREMNLRRIYIVTHQLKIAYRAQQKAQNAESKASNAKKRFASYIFHEVRVPLNTAMLSYQNLQTANAFKDDALVHQNVEVYALEASLMMMQQVLNDALDLQKMDAGRFESKSRAFPLHRSVQSILGPVGVAASAKNLQLVSELDERIDLIASPFVSSDGLWVLGDEIRLRQILTNLASNAIKFTPDGGAIKVVTKLVAPLPDEHLAPAHDDSSLSGDSSSTARRHTEGGSVKHRKNTIVFRVEIHDSGPGIRPSDLVDGRLFQPFVQTNVGKLSGKGSGLGLAIVRQIVTLSGGRLGLQSRKGSGTVFWVELSYALAGPEEVQAAMNTLTPTLLPPVALERPEIPPVVSILHPAPAADEEEGRHKVSFVGSDPQFLPPLPTVDLKSTRPRPASPQEPAPPAGAGGARPDVVSPAASTLSMPSVTSPPLSAAEAAPEALRVLVVDDDPMTRTLMTRMLKKTGCAVDTADDGQQCLDKMLAPDARRYDLVCLDNYMPVLTGEETVRKLRFLGRTDLVVGCTGNALSEDQSAYITAGADRVLTKPIMLRDLKAVLDVARQRRAAPVEQPPADGAERLPEAKDFVDCEPAPAPASRPHTPPP